MADEEDTEKNEDAENEDTPEGEGEDGEGEEGGGGKKKLILIVVGVVVLLLAVGAGLFFTGMLDSLLGKAAHECVEVTDDHGEVIEECPEEEEGDGHEEAGGGDGHGGDDGHGGGASLFLEIPTILVNLSSSDGTPRYLRLTVQLEMYSSADNASVEAVIPRVVDKFQTYLRELRVKDLRGSAGMYRLQTELLWRVNQAAAPVKVKNVLFQEILIQ